MRKYEQLKDIDGNLVDPKNLNYEIRLKKLENMKDVYSSEEVKTNKVLIDESGKEWPIYRKVFEGTTGTGGDWASFPLNITNLNEITDMRFKCGNSGEMYTSNFYVSTTYQIIFRLGSSKVQYLLGSGYSNLIYKVTVEYTKTTN